MLELVLKQINVGGIYGTPPHLPPRMRWLHPEAADSLTSFQKQHGTLICSDVFRSPEASLQAAAEKRGVMPPGFSAHNFGFAIDVAVEATLKAWGVSYQTLVSRLEDAGWFCHRRDGKERRPEWWHFNHLGQDGGEHLKAARAAAPSTWHLPAESRIQAVYGSQLKLTNSQAQLELKALRYYGGAVDGVIGPLSKQAISAFRRAWRLGDGSTLDAETQRVLAIVSAQRREV